MKMIGHVGRVVEIDGDQAVVEVESGDACRPAGGLASCGCCAGLHSARRRLHVERAGLVAGDRVEVSIPAYAGYLKAMSGYGLPLVALVVGLVIGGRFEPDGGANDMATIMGGLTGLGVGVGAAALANRLLSRGRNRPQVRRLGPGGAWAPAAPGAPEARPRAACL